MRLLKMTETETLPVGRPSFCGASTREPEAAAASAHEASTVAVSMNWGSIVSLRCPHKSSPTIWGL